MKIIYKLISTIFIVWVIMQIYSNFKETTYKPQTHAAQSSSIKKEALFTIDKSEKMQTSRREFLKKLISNGIFKKIEKTSSLVHVWVDSGFMLVDYEAKKSFLEVVYCYYYNGNDSGDSVIINDNLTGKKIGSYHPVLGLNLN